MADASDRGWGPGWPNCQPSKINKQFGVKHAKGTTYFPGGLRNELCELVDRLVKECVNRGYLFGNKSDPSYGCWGYNCRAISGTTKPSNHSWGLAVDINAPANPYKYPPVVTDMPSWMPDLWNAYGWRWGGDYSSGKVDAMHYEFMGTPAQAAQYTEIARANNLGGGSKPKPTVIGDHMFLAIQAPSGAVWLISDSGYQCPIDDANSWFGIEAAGVKLAKVDDNTFSAMVEAAKSLGRTG